MDFKYRELNFSCLCRSTVIRKSFIHDTLDHSWKSPTNDVYFESVKIEVNENVQKWAPMVTAIITDKTVFIGHSNPPHRR